MAKVKEKSDKYYLVKYQLTEEELNAYKLQKEEIGDPDIIIEDLIPPTISLSLSNSEKIKYLTKLRKKIITILFLIEEHEKEPENPTKNPEGYIDSMLFDLNSTNVLFNDELTEVVIKIYGIRQGYKSSEHSVIRKQVLETRRLVDDLLTAIRENEVKSK